MSIKIYDFALSRFLFNNICVNVQVLFLISGSNFSFSQIDSTFHQILGQYFFKYGSISSCSSPVSQLRSGTVLRFHLYFRFKIFISVMNEQQGWGEGINGAGDVVGVG